MSDCVSQASTRRAGDSRWESLRYYSLYRLILASGLALVGHAFVGAPEALTLWRVVVAAYFVAAVLLLYFQRLPCLAFRWILHSQITVDLAALSVLMYLSGGHRGGMAYPIMVVVAAGGLLGEGRLVHFYAALATLGALFVQTLLMLRFDGDAGAQFGAVGLLCIGFFAVATVARLLAQRALQNEQLAYQRGSALTRQILVNERIIADLDDGVLVVGATGALRQLNPSAEALLGPAARAGAILADVSPSLAAALGHATGEAVIGSGGAHVRLRVRSAGDGGDRVIFLEDLERIELEARQIKLAALGRLSGSIAHEIRNPLSAISQAGELLTEEKRAETQTRLVRIILDNTRRIDRLVANVLELGRRDRVTPESISFDAFVNGFIEESCNFGGLAPGLVACTIPAGFRLRFDRVHLQQILWNLVGNARRYCSGLPAAIRIAAARRGDGRVTIEVRDDGPGMSSEIRSRAFEPFFTTDAKGTGLGLYIARELAQANDAELELCESLAGAHFCLTAEEGA